MIMDIKDTKEGAELIWQLNKVGDYNTHKELWDAYYNLERLVKNCSIPDVSHRLSELNKLRDWLDNLKESEHYCRYELDFGMERDEIYDYIEHRKRQLNGG